MIKGLIFDFDGTLIESNDVKRSVFLSLASEEANGLAVMQSILELPNLDRYEIWKKFATALNKNNEFADIKADLFNKKLRSAMRGTPEVPGATNLLKFLQQRELLVFISSMTPTKELLREIKRRNWRDYVCNAFGSPNEKGRTLNRVMRDYALRESELLVIGDGADDKESASAYGIKFFNVGEGRGATSSERIYTIKEIHALITRIMR